MLLSDLFSTFRLKLIIEADCKHKSELNKEYKL